MQVKRTKILAGIAAFIIGLAVCMYIIQQNGASAFKFLSGSEEIQTIELTNAQLAALGSDLIGSNTSTLKTEGNTPSSGSKEDCEKSGIPSRSFILGLISGHLPGNPDETCILVKVVGHAKVISYVNLSPPKDRWTNMDIDYVVTVSYKDKDCKIVTKSFQFKVKGWLQVDADGDPIGVQQGSKPNLKGYVKDPCSIDERINRTIGKLCDCIRPASTSATTTL